MPVNPANNKIYILSQKSSYRQKLYQSSSQKICFYEQNKMSHKNVRFVAPVFVRFFAKELKKILENSFLVW